MVADLVWISNWNPFNNPQCGSSNQRLQPRRRQRRSRSHRRWRLSMIVLKKQKPSRPLSKLWQKNMTRSNDSTPFRLWVLALTAAMRIPGKPSDG